MKNKYYWLLAVLAFVYLVTVLVFQSDSATLIRYHMTDAQMKISSLLIVVPSMAIWFAAFYGLVNVTRYYDAIKKTKEGEGYKQLTRGLITLGIGMPITAVLSRLLTYAAQQHVMTQAAVTIINTHMTLLYTLVGFIFLFLGARQLLKTAKTATLNRSHVIGVAIVTVLIGAVYAYATLINPAREVAANGALKATYYMSDIWIILTIVIPYIVLWAFGFYTSLMLYTYYHNIGGKLYKKALITLNKGFFVVILSLIVVQFLTAATTTITGWSIGPLMLLIYLLLFIIAIGYVYVALGAKRLAKLEEIL